MFFVVELSHIFCQHKIWLHPHAGKMHSGVPWAWLQQIGSISTQSNSNIDI